MIPTQPLPANDEDSAKRRQIVEGARKVFRELGFDAASMGEIAKAAGVSKGTLYVYFADKNRLFEAIVEEEALEKGEIVFNLDPAREVTITLREFGEAYIGVICRPGGGSSIRTVMAIAERMPDVGRRYYAQVLESTIDRLAVYLKAHVELGELAIDSFGHAKSFLEQGRVPNLRHAVRGQPSAGSPPTKRASIQPRASRQSSIRACAAGAGGTLGARLGSETMCRRWTSGACRATESWWTARSSTNTVTDARCSATRRATGSPLPPWLHSTR